MSHQQNQSEPDTAKRFLTKLFPKPPAWDTLEQATWGEWVLCGLFCIALAALTAFFIMNCHN